MQLLGYTLPYTPSIGGVWVQVMLIFIIVFFLARYKKSKFSIAFEMFFEAMYGFFEEVLGERESQKVKRIIVSIFFVVFGANVIGRLADIIGQAYPRLEHILSAFSSDRSSVFAMATMIVLFTLIIQAKHVGIGKFFLEYIPIFGKGFITIEKGNLPTIIFYPLFAIVKLFDICISLFIGLLDIIGTGARIISLSFRLYGNMIAGTVLLVLLTNASKQLTHSLLGIEFPIILPLILFAQGLLVAFVQAFVVSLLTAIFVKMAKS